MKAKARVKPFAEIPVDYAGLIGMYPLRPLRDRVDDENATEIIDAMAGHDLSADQADYLDVLSTLVEEYESEHDPVRLPANKPLMNLRRLMKDHDMTAADLGKLLGNRGLGAQILNGRRPLNLAHIKKLMRRFAVDATVFI